MLWPKQNSGETVSFQFRFSCISDLLSAEELHSKEGKDENEEKEQEQERDDGTHTVEQRYDEIAQRRPVSTQHTHSRLVDCVAEEALALIL